MPDTASTSDEQPQDRALRRVGLAPTTVQRPDVALAVPSRPGDPTVLVLHGLAGYGGEWTALIDELPDEFGVIAPDQRAHGRSHGEQPSDVSAQRWVDDAIACIEASAADRVTVVGQSMGGIVATMLAADRPDLVQALVLIEAGIAPLGGDDLSGLQSWLDSWPDVFATKGEARRFFGKDERSTPAWVGGLRPTNDGLQAAFDSSVMVAAITELAGDDRTELFASLTVPTLVIRATQSALDDADIAAMATAGPDAEMAIIAGGHDLHLEEPALIAAMIMRCALDAGVQADLGAPEPMDEEE